MTDVSGLSAGKQELVRQLQARVRKEIEHAVQSGELTAEQVPEKSFLNFEDSYFQCTLQN